MLLRAHALKFNFVTPISDICNAGELAEWSGGCYQSVRRDGFKFMTRLGSGTEDGEGGRRGRTSTPTD